MIKFACDFCRNEVWLHSCGCFTALRGEAIVPTIIDKREAQFHLCRYCMETIVKELFRLAPETAPQFLCANSESASLAPVQPPLGGIVADVGEEIS